MPSAARTEAACLASVDAEHSQNMRNLGNWAARNRDRITADWNSLPPTLQERIQADMKDPARIARANREWADL